MELNQIAPEIAMSGLLSTYAFAQRANEDMQEEKIERILVNVKKNHRLNAYRSSTSTVSNLSEVLQ